MFNIYILFIYLRYIFKNCLLGILSCMLHTFRDPYKNLLKCGDKKIDSKNPQ